MIIRGMAIMRTINTSKTNKWALSAKKIKKLASLIDEEE